MGVPGRGDHEEVGQLGPDLPQLRTQLCVLGLRRDQGRAKLGDELVGVTGHVRRFAGPARDVDPQPKKQLSKLPYSEADGGA